MSDLMAFQYRMPAGFVGDVTRMTPAAIIEPCGADPTSPPTMFGQVVTVDATSAAVRPIALAAEVPYGVTVRGFPGQAPNASGYYGAAGFGNVIPWLAAGNPQPTVDVMRQGYMMVNTQGTPRKGLPVFVWTAATAAPHTRGGFEAVDPTTNGRAIPNCTFNGAADAFGNVEISFGI